MRTTTLFIFSLFWFLLGFAACDKQEVTLEATNDESFKMIPYLTFEQWQKRQGGAVYKNMLVCVNAMDRPGIPNGFIYDVRSGKKICDMCFVYSLDGRDYYPPHANQVSFGKKFYNEESDFPLLYVSQVNGGSGYNDIRGERGVLVYNLKNAGSGIYVPELVQAIIPDLNDENLMSKIGNYTPNYIIDTDNNQFVVIGYPNNSWYNLSGEQPVTVFNIPNLADGKEIMLTYNDIVDSYNLSFAVAPQQSFYYRGRIYSVAGDSGHASFRVINLESKTAEYYKDMTGITAGEPQFLGLWNGKMLYYEYDETGMLYELMVSGYQFENNNTAHISNNETPKGPASQLYIYDLHGIPKKAVNRELKIIEKE